MAKAKKRVATRKKSSKRSKASARPAHKKAAKRTRPKQAKSKVKGAVKIQGQGTTATEDNVKEGTQKNAKTSGRGAGRGHDHRRDRGTGSRRGCCYRVRNNSTGNSHFIQS